MGTVMFMRGLGDVPDTVTFLALPSVPLAKYRRRIWNQGWELVHFPEMRTHLDAQTVGVGTTVKDARADAREHYGEGMPLAVFMQHAGGWWHCQRRWSHSPFVRVAWSAGGKRLDVS